MKHLVEMSVLIYLLSITTVMAQMENPYRLVFQKPLELKGDIVIESDKVTERLRRGEWKQTRVNSMRMRCDTSIKIEGRDLAIKNSSIGEHYYGSMQLDCKNHLYSFKTHFKRALFLGIRNCVQSETVFDQDYCRLKVITFRNERDINQDHGDLITKSLRTRKFFKVHSQMALESIKSSKLVPEGLQLNIVDSVQAFTINLGKNAETFFIEKPNDESNFAKGNNIYIDADADVLALDQKIRAELDQTYSVILNKLQSLPSGANGLTAFEKELPSILVSFSGALKKLLTIIAPTEFFQAENKLKSLEKMIIETAAIYRSNIRNRDEFRANYRGLSDEYNRFGTYLDSKSNSAIVHNSQQNFKIQYHIKENSQTMFRGESKAFDLFLDSICYSKTVEKRLIDVVNANQSIQHIRNELRTISGYQDVWLRINLTYDSRYISQCVSDYVTYVMGRTKKGTVIWQEINRGGNGNEYLDRIGQASINTAMSALLGRFNE
jgi:hypothetical protein